MSICAKIARLVAFLSVAVALFVINTFTPLVAAQTIDPSLSISTIQQAALDGATRSITFLSSGYTDEASFLDDVVTCTNALGNDSAGILADPWPRYMPLMNVYAVYERSPQAGASRPHGRLHDCAWMKSCTGPVVNNNLGCTFGTPNPHFMSCDVNSVVSMAAVAPAQDLAVVLINADDPGGVATSGLAYITNEREFMPFMLVHYLNRAMAELHEEYSLGLPRPEGGASSAQEFVAPNCAISRADAMTKWEYWFESGATQLRLAGDGGEGDGQSDEVFLVELVRMTSFAFGATTTPWRYSIATLPPPLHDATLGDGCSFGSFVAPINAACMMRNSSINFMCPVCREQLARSFHTNGVNGSVLLAPSSASVNLLSQRCPPEGHTTYVDVDNIDDDSTEVAPLLYLTVGAALAQNDMAVTWTLDDGTTLATGETTLTVPGSVVASWTLPVTITASVTDNCPHVRPSWRTDAFTATTTFRVDRRVAGVTTCLSPAPACLVADGVPADVCVAAADSRRRSLQKPKQQRQTVPSYEVVDIQGSAPGAVYNKRNAIIVACTTGGVAVAFIIIIFMVHSCVVRRRPREVLNAQLVDRMIYFFLVPCCVLNLVIAVLVLVFSTAFIPEDFFRGLQLMIPAVVLGSIVYLVAVVNICGALFRWYAACLACCVLFFLLGLGLFAIGIIAVWAHFNQEQPGLSRNLASLWMNTLRKDQAGQDYVCSLQFHLSCSGYHAGCFMTNSQQCPDSCGANLFVNPCQAAFLGFVGQKYLPVGVLGIIGGFAFVFTAALDALYFMRYRQLSRTGKLRRLYRKDPRAPVVPITHHECRKVRGFFAQVCDRPAETLEGASAVQFLQTIFGDAAFDRPEREHIRALGPVTFDQLLSAYFPYVVSAASDPRMLTPDEAEDTAGMVELQRRQHAKLLEYAAAAGALSPEKLHEIFVRCTARRFLPETSELLAAIREEAAVCRDAPMCRGLRPVELEGLRAAWVALHPSIAGALSGPEIRILHRWCYGQSIEPGDEDGLINFEAVLDVRRTGSVGWGEFCYPYAQRALLRAARSFLASLEKEIPPEMMLREVALFKYGAAVVDESFLPNEKKIPLERLIAFLLRHSIREG